MNVFETIRSHRSIRAYKEKEVDEKLLNEILEAGTRASTTGNMQVYSIVATRDKDLRRQLWECHFKQDMVLQAPVHLTFCADINRFNRWCMQRNAEPGYDNFLWFVNAAIDALLASQNVCIAAEGKGLGICYLGTATYNADKIIDILHLPRGVVPVAAIVLGYPANEPPLTDRLPLEGVVHHDTYKDYSEDAIEHIYRQKEGLEASKSLIEENQTENLAQIFTDKRYKKADNLHFSEKYMETIRKQGFLNH